MPRRNYQRYDEKEAGAAFAAAGVSAAADIKATSVGRRRAESRQAVRAKMRAAAGDARQ